MTSKVNGKTGNLTPCISETPENFSTKTEQIDYVAGGNTHAKFYGNRHRGVRRTNSQNITSLCTFPSLSFPFFPSFFSCRRLQQKRMDVSHRSLRVLSQGCAFWGWENLNLIFNWNYTMSEDDDIVMMPWNFSMRKYSKRIFAVFYV